jgi:hypothetical protein
VSEPACASRPAPGWTPCVLHDEEPPCMCSD